MATSGTTTFDLDLTSMADEAWDRASGGASELRTGYEMRSVRRSLNLLLADLSNRGLNMWTFEQGSTPLVQGTATYALPDDTVDLMEVMVRINDGVVLSQSDLYVSRISLSVYATLNNKLLQARPNQYVVNRTASPSVTLWPVPDQSAYYTLQYWRLRRVQDAGNGGNTMDVPFRMLPAMTAGLAYYIALKIPEGAARLPFLKQSYDEAWQLAYEEDREKATLRLVPGRY